MKRMIENDDKNNESENGEGKEKPPIIVPPIDVAESSWPQKNGKVIRQANNGVNKPNNSKGGR